MLYFLSLQIILISGGKPSRYLFIHFILYFLHEWLFHFHWTKINKIKYYIVLEKFLFLIALYLQLHFLTRFSHSFNEYLLFDQSPKDLLERSFVWIFYIQRITERQNKVVITDRMWARLLASTNQPSFLNAKQVTEVEKEGAQTQTQLGDGEITKDDESLTKDIPSLT